MLEVSSLTTRCLGTAAQLTVKLPTLRDQTG